MSFEAYIPPDILDLYEIYDYRHAAAILANEFPTEFAEICDGLRNFKISEANIVERGGSESQIPKSVSNLLRPMGWRESQLNAKLMVDDTVISYDSHKIDYVKGRVAFDLEWNSKDQTYDRDLYAFRAFFDYNKISVGILLTRSNQLDALFKKLRVFGKYGASTTQMGKLLPRLNAGRNGGCPVLVLGITPKIIDTVTNDDEKTITNEEVHPIISEDIKNLLMSEDENDVEE